MGPTSKSRISSVSAVTNQSKCKPWFCSLCFFYFETMVVGFYAGL